MNWRKSEGSDGIVVEMIEAAGSIATKKVLALANKIYRTGEIPEIMKEAEFTVISKKESTTDCQKLSTISIMRKIAQIVLKVI